ncbi:helix-turn-helix domain-containing protein [Cerasicoccus arenae]|nr:AraC family transcriptional regulator [Cerasicoccus arenae]MBK1857576.1 helix-turn-helix transcriptional regulator [Cerasicoccus arenae]
MDSPSQMTSSAAARISDWSRLRVELLWAYEGVILPRNISLPRDIEPGIPVYFIRKGSLTIETESGQLEVGAGSWVVITQKLLCRDFALDSDIISIRFVLSRPDGRSFFDSGMPKIFQDQDHPELKRNSDDLLTSVKRTTPAAYVSLWKEWSDLGGFLLIQENFFAWLRCLTAICEKVDAGLDSLETIDERTQRALRFLDSEKLTTNLREATIAEAAGLSVSQLNRLFIKGLGETPKQYWDRRKLNAAISLLSSSVTPIKLLANDLGFTSQNYFARWFRAQTKLSPREYREKFSQEWRRYD